MGHVYRNLEPLSKNVCGLFGHTSLKPHRRITQTHRQPLWSCNSRNFLTALFTDTATRLLSHLSVKFFDGFICTTGLSISAYVIKKV